MPYLRPDDANPSPALTSDRESHCRCVCLEWHSAIRAGGGANGYHYASDRHRRAGSAFRWRLLRLEPAPVGRQSPDLWGPGLCRIDPPNLSGQRRSGSRLQCLP
jgi:hypothetical protein